MISKISPAPAPNNETRRNTVIIAILTYRRRGPLKACLGALQDMDAPDGYQVTLLIIDNDPERSVFESAESWNALSHRYPLRCVHEPTRGIPAARNRALDEAMAADADLLCFIDDDEQPDSDWLVSLSRCRSQSGAELIGGPVYVTEAPDDANFWQRFINASLQARSRRSMARTARRFATGGRFTIVTNNWMCDLAWLRGAGLRFDEHLQFTGGSDTLFFREAKRAGCKVAWCDAARVRETQPLSRLSLTYQFRRAQSQSINHYRFKRLKPSGFQGAAVALHAGLRLLSGAILLVVPIYGIASPVIAVRSIGWAFGRWRAIVGRESQLYRS